MKYLVFLKLIGKQREHQIRKACFVELGNRSFLSPSTLPGGRFSSAPSELRDQQES